MPQALRAVNKKRNFPCNSGFCGLTVVQSFLSVPFLDLAFVVFLGFLFREVWTFAVLSFVRRNTIDSCLFGSCLDFVYLFVFSFVLILLACLSLSRNKPQNPGTRKKCDIKQENMLFS